MPGFLRIALATLVAVLALSAPGAAQQDDHRRLAAVLQLNDVLSVLREEGLDYGRELDRDMLGGSGGDRWAREMERIYDMDEMRATMLAALGEGMSADAVRESIAFFDTPRGQRILMLETAARRAMSDPDIEDAARTAFDRMQRDRADGAQLLRLEQLERFVAINDLIERNVAGTMSASYWFFRGLADGGASDMDDAAIIAEVWAEEDDTRRDTELWIFALLLMAFDPLEPDEIEAYIEFSGTSEGRALNAALFAGFDRVYNRISHAMGLAVAQASTASDL